MTMIRNFHKDELDVVMQLWMNSVTESHSFIPREYWLQQYTTVRNDHMSAAKTFVCGEFGRLRGFVSILEDAFIGALFVDPEYWHEGIGTQLIQYVQERYDRLSLSVYCKNTGAVSFYQKHGFQIVKEQPDGATGEMEYSMEWNK